MQRGVSPTLWDCVGVRIKGTAVHAKLPRSRSFTGRSSKFSTSLILGAKINFSDACTRCAHLVRSSSSWPPPSSNPCLHYIKIGYMNSVSSSLNVHLLAIISSSHWIVLDAVSHLIGGSYFLLELNSNMVQPHLGGGHWSDSINKYR